MWELHFVSAELIASRLGLGSVLGLGLGLGLV